MGLSIFSCDDTNLSRQEVSEKYKTFSCQRCKNIIKKHYKIAVKMCGSPQIEANHMTNLTVKPGAKVVFNCKVNDVTIRDLYAYYSRLTSRAWCPLSAGTMRWRMAQRCWSRPPKTPATPKPWTSPLSPWQTWGCTPVWQKMWLGGIMLLRTWRWIAGARLD